MEKSTEYRHGRTVVSSLHVHLVFVARYRHKIFMDWHYEAMKEIFARVCEKFKSELIEVDGEHDHVHLLINYPPTVYLPELVNSLKGVSSRLLRSRYPALKRDCKGDALWSPSYFVASCGGAPLEIIKQYIEQQRI